MNTDGYIRFATEEIFIAPFLANVDTRGTGTVFYRQTDDVPLMTGFAQYFESISDFSPTSLFIATWDGVGSYDSNTHLVSRQLNKKFENHYFYGSMEKMKMNVCLKLIAWKV